MSVHPISAVLADIDGTMVTKDKVLTERAIQAVNRLRERGIVFTICSGRPPRGMRMLVEPLRLTTPMAAFNGGVIVLPDLSVLDERAIPDYLVPAIVEAIQAHGLDVWIYSATDWYILSREAPRVDRDIDHQSEPTVVAGFDGLVNGVIKIVGVSDDHDKVATCEAALQKTFSTQVSAARSQPYYLDVTHTTANKGSVVDRLARYLKIPTEAIATIGDQPSDVSMFLRSGLSVAMGNANEDVQRQATHVSASHEDEGFAEAGNGSSCPAPERPGPTR
jgi:Cof subfamily protein (haloacid dehalogenase superfamily)